MSKTIKLEDPVYDQLEKLRQKRETFSQVVERLQGVFSMLERLADVVEGRLTFLEWEKERKEKTESQ